MTNWVLVIDDDADNRELLSELLESAGHIVQSCGSGEAATRVLDEKGRPGMVVCDVRLPDIAGPTFVARMRLRPAFADTPVVFVTGVGPAGTSGVLDPVLVKPIDVDVLLDLLARHCPPDPRISDLRA